MSKYILFATIAILLLTVNLFADCRAESPERLIEVIKESFNKGDIGEFNCAFEVENGQNLLKNAVAKKYGRQFDFGKVIISDKKRATLLLTGLVKRGNSGDETYFAGKFSGIYEAEVSGDGWKVKRELPIAQNTINSQTLDVTVVPAQKLVVKDDIAVSVRGNFGFAINLNHRASIQNVKVDGKEVNFQFGGGLLWVNIPPSKTARLSIEYELNEIDTNQADSNSSFWGSDFGHVRNQFYWHPLFDFNSETGKSDFKIIARIPKEYQLVTTIPQTESIDGTMRIVTGKTQIRTQALALFYDKDWKKASKNFGSLRFDIFATEDFSPSVEEMQIEFQKVYQKLESKFGKPAANYFSVVQSRARTTGWKFLTNQTITAGTTGAKIISDTPNIRAPFAHEISHAWTNPTGKGAHFLREGWASFIESYFIRETFGAETESAYFTKYRKLYNEGGFEGKQSILEDADNAGISYYKGVWIFKMLRDFIGEESFERGMMKYVSDSRNGKGTTNDFIAAFADVTKKDVKTFLKPWIEKQNLPNISAELSSGKLKINQKELIFLLPLEIEFETATGKIRKTFLISKSTEFFDLKNVGDVKAFHLDPDNQLLLKSQTQ